MQNTRQLIPAVGLLTTIAIAVYMVVQLNAQAPLSGDFTNAGMAEVRDGQGEVVLRGQFQLADEEDDDVERKATLEPAGADPDAAGEAEVEFAKDAPAEQEVEFSVRNVEPGIGLTFVIDGVIVGTGTADSRGRADVDIDVRVR